MSSAYENCTAITLSCPVEATTYGYYPSLPGNAIFLAINAACALIQVYFGIRYKTWLFMVGIGLGCLSLIHI